MAPRPLSPENDLSTEELLARVMVDLRSDDDSSLSALVALHGRPTQVVIDNAVAMCRGDEPYTRTVGLRILRELDHRTVDRHVIWGTVEPLVVGLVNDDGDPEVIRNAISCLGYHHCGTEALTAVVAKARDADPNIRFAVASNLPSLIESTGAEGEPVNELVQLTMDDDAEVRSYALMGLIELGLGEVRREVVEARLDDPDEQIRRFATEFLNSDREPE